jgi:hypothetical protein
MSDTTLLFSTWLAFVLHVAIALVTLRRWSALPLVSALNGIVALCVLAYWLPRWYGYAFKNIIWYGGDQWMPLCALAVLALAVLTLTGRFAGTTTHWIIYAIDGLALLAAALFFTFFRMDRLF